MNKEILKAIEDKQKKHPFRDWWCKNDYKVMRIILFPIWIYVEISDQIKNWNYKRITWDEKRANEILNYYVPKRSDWLPEKKTFWFFDNGYGQLEYLRRKDRLFWRKFHWEIEKYLVNKFELEEFEKEVLHLWGSTDTEIIFKMIDK